MTYEKSETFDKFIILFFRLTMGWTFLWAGIHHFGDSKFVLGFLSHVKTFHRTSTTLLIDYHIVYAGVLVYLIAKRAGHVFGLDGLLERIRLTEHYPALRPLVG